MRQRQRHKRLCVLGMRVSRDRSGKSGGSVPKNSEKTELLGEVLLEHHYLGFACSMLGKSYLILPHGWFHGDVPW